MGNVLLESIWVQMLFLPLTKYSGPLSKRKGCCLPPLLTLKKNDLV